MINFSHWKDNWAIFQINGKAYGYYIDPCKQHTLGVIARKSHKMALNYAKDNAISETKENAA